jgi:hypothetical protein
MPSSVIGVQVSRQNAGLLALARKAKTMFGFRNLLLLLAGMLAIVCGQAALAAQGGNMFVLHSAYAPEIDSELLKRPYIRGVALQVGWRDIEPREGQYHWERIDELIALAQREHKLVTLHILPLRPPEWIFDAGAQEFSFPMKSPDSPMFGRTLREVVPWDGIYLAKWADMVHQFGARYNSNPAVFAVSVTAPTPEMVLPGSFPRNTEAYQRINRIYDQKAYLAAWKKMVDVYQEYFPDKYKILAPGIVLDDYRFGDDVVQYANQKFGRKLIVFNAGLRAVLPTAIPPWAHIYSLLKEYGQKSNLGFQTIWNATNDRGNRLQGSLKSTLANAAEMGASYVEVYEVDVNNAALQSDLIAGAEALPALR